MSTEKSSFCRRASAALAGAAAVVLAYGIMLADLTSNVGLAEASFGDFAMHPALMATAFVVIGPLATVTYASEGATGLDHETAKKMHAAMHFCALTLGMLGTRSMWITHEGGVHFQTLHSWIGITILVAYTAQFVCGLYVFYYAPGATRAAFLPVHIFSGLVIVFGALVTVLLGVLALVWKSKNVSAMNPSSYDHWFLANTAGMFVAAEIVALAFVLYARDRTTKETGRASTTPKTFGSIDEETVGLTDTRESEL